MQLADLILVPEQVAPAQVSFFPENPPGTAEDTTKNPNRRLGDGTHQPVFHSPLYLKNPQNVQVVYELAPDGKGYYVYERVGGVDIRPPSYITREAFVHLKLSQTKSTYWRELSLAQGDTTKKQKGLIPTFDLAKVNDIFGGGSIDIRPVGTVGLRLGVVHTRNENPFLPLRQQRSTYFDFPPPQIQMGLNAKIGEKMKFDLNYDTQAMFNFDNLQKLKYEGNEDQILQSIQAGNVSFPLGNTLIQGRQNLMGLRVGTKWGPVRVTGIVGMEQSKNSCITIPGGTRTVQTPFKKAASKYDAKRHYFLNHYFRSKYESALNSPIFPLINSEFRITRVEVYVTNQQSTQTQNLRAAVGLLDLGENQAANGGRIFNSTVTGTATGRYPDNKANSLFGNVKKNEDATLTYKALGALNNMGLRNSVDYELINSLRRLQPNEYRLNDQLGYISLSTPLRDDQVLMVAFEYSSLKDGKVYQVGEFSTDVPATAENNNALILKLLKPSLVRVAADGDRYPAWDLMMKNIYNTEGFNLTDEEFYVDVFYETGTTAGRVNFLPQDASLPTNPIADKQFMQVMGIDRLTNNTAPKPDNYFDFVEGLTVIAEKGLVIFPVLEPFGSHLYNKMDGGNNPQLVEKYVYSTLYSETQADAENKYTQYNRFSIEGFYQSKSSGSGTDIPLNAMNLTQGSVRVTMGSSPLVENVHYRVDYQSGRLQILDPSVLQSGQDVKICFEGNNPYSQNKSMTGVRVETDIARDVTVGASVLRMRNRPLIAKTTLGDEAYANTIWGADLVAKRDIPLLTKALDRLPLLQTKAPSKIEGVLEFAQFIPGQPKTVPSVYIDDFEASKTTYLLQGLDKWRISSLPLGGHISQPDVSGVHPNLLELKSGFNRAHLSWYSIDFTSFFNGSNPARTPQSDLSNNYTRQIYLTELFATATPAVGAQVKNPLDLLYIPSQRGPYNYQTSPNAVNPDGSLKDPEKNWAGIMRPVDFGSNNDFEAANIEYLEFWLMDPFLDESLNDGSGGDLYLNLGRVTEDVIPDGIQSVENALPLDSASNDGIIASAWGRMTTIPPTNQYFAADPNSLKAQDVGLDGLTDGQERTHFNNYPFLPELGKIVAPDALAAATADPSSDNFQHFRADAYEGKETPMLTRFLHYNGSERNSPVGADAQRNGYTISGSNIPDGEDVNRNNAPNFIDEYWEYHISLKPGDLEQGQNYIVFTQDTTISVSTGASTVQKKVRWHQFRVPLREGQAVNGASNFKSVDFMRLYMTGFKDTVILRMVDFQFVQTQWRRYESDLCDVCPGNPATFHEQGSISYQENSGRQPFNYTYPPETPTIQQNNSVQAGTQVQDERSMVMRVCDLASGDARALYRILPYDLRNYERLKLWVHAEPSGSNSNFQQAGDLNGFMRLGLDNDLNYYEYEINLLPSEARAMPAVSDDDIRNIWRNQIDIELSQLVAAKAARDQAGASLTQRYEYIVPSTGDRIYVKGTPKISDIATIMIGVRNPKTHAAPVCAEVWFNELRVTDFKDNKSSAANASINLTLADFATLNATGSYRQAGFGPLDQRASARTLEDSWQYTVRASVALGKLFPQSWGLSIPVAVTRSDNVVRPLYDPMQADVPVASLLAQEGVDADSIRARVDTRQQTRGIAFSNVKKNRTAGSPAAPGSGKPASQTPGNPGAPPPADDKPKIPMPYDLSNFDFSFAYNERESSSPSLQSKLVQQHTGAINYTYMFPKAELAPFKNAKFMKKPNPIKDMSFNPLPANVSVSVNGERTFQERTLRPAVGFEGNVASTYSKNFLINRVYTVSWPLTPNLTANFNATTVARVDEVRGRWEDATEEERDSVGTLASNLLHFGQSDERTSSGRLRYPALINMGRSISYDQNLTLAYQLPFSKYKSTNFITGNVNYTSGLQWRQAPEAVPQIGGLMGNSRTIQGTAKADLGKLYQKIKPLKEVLALAQKQGPAGKPYRPQPQVPGQGGPRPPRKQPISKEQADDTRFMIPNPPETPPGTPKPATPEPPKDTTKLSAPLILKVIATQTARILLSVQSVDMNYQRTDGTKLPGYLPSISNIGLDNHYGSGSILPPTLGFVTGSQYDIRQLGANYGWLTQDTLLSNFYQQNFNEQLTIRASVEPVKALRIDLTFQRNSTEDFQELFRWNDDRSSFAGTNQYLVGNYSTSYIFLGTAFQPFPNKNNDYESDVFEDFRRTRSTISKRWFDRNAETNGVIPVELVEDSSLSGYYYYNGYLGSSQQVMIPSLLAAYGVFSPEKVSLSALPRITLPNWQINYNPMTAFPKLKSTFTAISIRHAYTGKYSTGSFLLNLNSVDTLNPYVNYRDPDYISPNMFVLDTTASGSILYNYLPTRTLANVVIEESFSPLIGVNMTLKNGVGATIAYNKSRNIALSAGAMQVNEDRKRDITFSLNYRKQQASREPIHIFGKTIKMQNQMEAKMTFSLRENIVMIRYVDGDRAPTVTQGNRAISISPSFNYTVSKRLTIGVVYDALINKPHTLQSYPTANHRAGIDIRFSFN